MGRWFYVLLRGLAGRGHRVTAIAAGSNPAQIDIASNLFRAPDYDLRCHLRQSRSGLRSKWRSLRRPRSYTFEGAVQFELESLLAQPYDVLHLESVWSGWLGLAHERRALLNVDYLNSIDADRAVYRSSSLLDKAIWLRTFAAEKHLLRRYRFIRTLTPRLSAEARRISPRSSVHTVPLGVDASLYPFRALYKPGTRPVVGLIGSFNWSPTASAGIRLMTRLWPEIKRRVSEARLLVVGFGAQQLLAEFRHLSDVTIADRLVSDGPDTVPFFQSIDLLLYAPVRGSGMKVKVLEAFAMGVPVVTTSEGIEGLPAQDGVHAGVCEDDEGLIDRTVHLLRNQNSVERQRYSARALLETVCGPQPTLDGIEEIYRNICQT